MPNSEDYLDGLLNSINKAKTDVTEAQLREEQSIRDKVADRNKVDPNDDFMDATGLRGFRAKKISHDNLRQAFSESEFLRDFEEELSTGGADDFIEAFEREIDEEEAMFQRGEEVPVDAGTEFVRSLMEEDGALIEDVIREDESAQVDDNVNGDDSEAEYENAADDLAEAVSDDEDDGPTDMDAASADELLNMAADISGLESFVEDGESQVAETEIDNEDDNNVDLSDNIEDVTDAQEVADTPGGDDTSNQETSDDAIEQEDTAADDAAELLSALGEGSDDDITNDQELMNILDEVQNIVGDEDSDESILPKEYQSDEHDASDSLEVNADGIALVDEDADLDALLQGEEGLSDIGDLLAADSENIELDEARDQFEASASIAEKGADSSSEESDGKPKESFISKILGIFKKKKKDAETEGEEELLNVAATNEIEDTSEENKKILEEMEAEDAEAAAKKEEKKAAAAAKKAEKKAAKEAKKAEKAAKKAEKAKEEKKPSKAALFFKEDKSKKTPIKVIVILVVLAGTLVAAALIGSNLYHKITAVNSAKDSYASGNYVEAFNKLNGLSGLSDSEIEILDKARLIADLQNKKLEYDQFMKKKDYYNAFDALVVGMGRYNTYKDDAKELGVSAEYDGVEAMIKQQLQDQFGVTEKDALQLYALDDRREYTEAINNKLEALGMKNDSDN